MLMRQDSDRTVSDPKFWRVHGRPEAEEVRSVRNWGEVAAPLTDAGIAMHLGADDGLAGSPRKTHDRSDL